MPVRLEELPHPEQVGPREAPKPWVAPREHGGEGGYDAVAPLGALELAAEVRAERAGTKKVPGDGRFYHIGFTATDPYGEYCVGTISVVVPHDMSKTPVDQGPLYDSTVP